MGRKKKEKKEEVKIKSNSTITYKGNVNISFVRKGKVVKRISTHNEGKRNLYSFILNCLAGEFIESQRPFWVIPFKVVNENGENKEYYSTTIAVPINDVEVINVVDTNEQSQRIPTLSYKILLQNSIFSGSTDISGLYFFSQESLPNNGSVSIEDAVSQDDINNCSMKMYFYNDKGSITINTEDLIITWQVQVASSTQEFEE